MTLPEPFEPYRVSPWTWCPTCFDRLAIEPESFFSYFEGQPRNCAKCGGALDWWQVILDAIKQHFMLTAAFHVLGAETLVFSTVLRTDSPTTVDLGEQGLPADATILSINLTASGRVLPLMVVGNTVRQAPLQRIFHLRGFPIPEEPLASEGNLSVAVTWIAPGENELSVRYLADAATEYDVGRYQDVVIPANIGVEAALSPAFGSTIIAHCDGTPAKAEERVKQVLSDAATYGFQLNPFLSVAASLLKVAPLNPGIRKLLNDLRQYRNDLAHTGYSKRQLVDKNRAAEFLAAAVFGYHYARYLDSKQPALGGAAPTT